MEEKKQMKISMSGFFLILAIIVIAVMGYFIYKISSEKAEKEKEIASLKNETSNLNAKVNELQGKLDSIANTINTNKNSSLSTESEQVKKLYNYIPAFNTNKISINAYQDRKISKENLPIEFLLENAFRNLEIEEKDKEYTPEGSWYYFNSNTLQNKVKEFYGEEIENKSFEIGYGSQCNYENGKYMYSSGGGSDEILENIRNIKKAYLENDNLYIEDSYMILIEKAEEEAKLYTSSERTELIDSKDAKNENDIKDFKNKNISKMKDYKHTFKKNADGNYYWYSTEPIK